MFGHLEAEEKRRQLELNRRAHGLIEFGNVTEAQANLTVLQSEIRQLPTGEPLVIQDANGVIAFIDGLHGPAKKD